MSLSRSSGAKKPCPKHQIRRRVYQNRCVNQKTFNEKVAKKLNYNNKRSSKRKSSSYSSKIQKDIEKMMKKMKSRSPRRTPEKMIKGLLSASLLQSIRKPSNPLKKVNRSPKKNQLLSQIKQGKQLKKTNTSVKKKSPKKSLLEQALAKKFININKTLPNKKKSSDSDSDWSDGIHRNNFT